MRVIAGTYRSRIWKSLKGLALRPTSDRLPLASKAPAAAPPTPPNSMLGIRVRQHPRVITTLSEHQPMMTLWYFD
jgi:hypothetical protein